MERPAARAPPGNCGPGPGPCYPGAVSVRNLQVGALETKVGGRNILLQDSDTVTWEVVAVDSDPDVQDIIKANAIAGPGGAIAMVAAGSGTVVAGGTDTVTINLAATPTVAIGEPFLAFFASGTEIMRGAVKDLEVNLRSSPATDGVYYLDIHNNSGVSVAYRYAVPGYLVP